ncbi:unnamed protein product [Nippostrongylus brasiliensis]|uniref:Uncharacterized protein n=1 Tax=Nippostrongylus brasiliensis TaxID=27835 RepID=A0A0N4YP67_NIPBR|nr:unnamed protein product [Nippostrongylus brasiliensis]
MTIADPTSVLASWTSRGSTGHCRVRVGLHAAFIVTFSSPEKDEEQRRQRNKGKSCMRVRVVVGVEREGQQGV